MSLTCQILAAVALDLLLGDPAWLPHPVRGIGWIAQRLETPVRRMLRSEMAAGLLTVALVVGLAGGAMLAGQALIGAVVVFGLGLVAEMLRQIDLNQN